MCDLPDERYEFLSLSLSPGLLGGLLVKEAQDAGVALLIFWFKYLGKHLPDKRRVLV